MKIRIVKTASNARAVQVVRYQQNKRIILHHVGSAHNEEHLKNLMVLAEEWIKDYSQQLVLFSDESPNKLLHLNHSTFVGVKYRYFYQEIGFLLDKMGLDVLRALLRDLVIIRIFEPASKLRSLELLNQYFGIHHNRKTFYKIAPKCIDVKETVEQKVVDFAKAIMRLATTFFFTMLPHFTLKLFKKMSCAKTVFLKTTNHNNHKY